MSYCCGHRQQGGGWNEKWRGKVGHRVTVQPALKLLHTPKTMPNKLLLTCGGFMNKKHHFIKVYVIKLHILDTCALHVFHHDDISSRDMA